MKVEKGNLKQLKTNYQVVVPTKKGTASLPIPAAAVCFRSDDAEDGLEVDVHRDDKNRIVKVIIPGKAEINAAPPAPKQNSHGQGRSNKYRGTQGSGPRAVDQLQKAPPSVLGMPFHNPYTFLGFEDNNLIPKRTHFTPHSIDGAEDDTAGQRYTGVIELEVSTKSPLMTCAPKAVSESKEHKTYKALTIGADVIVPASGIRGALRTLITIITGGSLGYLNERAFLIQGRDLNLGPSGANSPAGTPQNVFLAEVVSPGTEFRTGLIRLGQTRLVRLEALENVLGEKTIDRDPKAKTIWVDLDESDQPTKVREEKSPETPWKIKLSGRPINPKGKREGAFLPGEKTIEIPQEFWADYAGRHAHADHEYLKKGDLVWLEPRNIEATDIKSADDIKSLQWARWGRKGQSLKEHLDKPTTRHVLPDNLSGAEVDVVTDLFGQIKNHENSKTFAGRIRPENLVFLNAANKVNKIALAPLAPPHQGCVALYRKNPNPDSVSSGDPIKGYKVYRNQISNGQSAPWEYETQGVYNEKGQLKNPPEQKVNKTCDLVPADTTGKLRISFRSCTPLELALLIESCNLSWRLGGGKPIGLGLCEVKITRLLDEEGAELQLPEGAVEQSAGTYKLAAWSQHLAKIQTRIHMWQKSQEPVPLVRYPRAVDQNRFGKTRGGHAWFGRHASPRKVTRDGEQVGGLEPLYMDGRLKRSAQDANAAFDPEIPMISGQVLPEFNPDDPMADVMFGYDGYCKETRDEYRPRRRVFLDIEPFDPVAHELESDRSEGSHGKGQKFRTQKKQDRR